MDCVNSIIAKLLKQSDDNGFAWAGLHERRVGWYRNVHVWSHGASVSFDWSVINLFNFTKDPNNI